jgi:hypothetical protein
MANLHKIAPQKLIHRISGALRKRWQQRKAKVSLNYIKVTKP